LIKLVVIMLSLLVLWFSLVKIIQVLYGVLFELNLTGKQKEAHLIHR